MKYSLKSGNHKINIFIYLLGIYDKVFWPHGSIFLNFERVNSLHMTNVRGNLQGSVL